MMDQRLTRCAFEGLRWSRVARQRLALLPRLECHGELSGVGLHVAGRERLREMVPTVHGVT